MVIFSVVVVVVAAVVGASVVGASVVGALVVCISVVGGSVVVTICSHCSPAYPIAQEHENTMCVFWNRIGWHVPLFLHGLSRHVIYLSQLSPPTLESSN